MSKTQTHSASASHWSRRGVIFGLTAAVAAGGVFAANWYNIGADLYKNALSVREAHALALRDEILLVDIRRPDEWARTGVGEGAVPLDMRREDFVTALQDLRAGRDIPVALICARGVRSKRLTQRLTEAGITGVIDVPEGMLGSGAGPGWLRDGLPVVRS